MQKEKVDNIVKIEPKIHTKNFSSQCEGVDANKIYKITAFGLSPLGLKVNKQDPDAWGTFSIKTVDLYPDSIVGANCGYNTKNSKKIATNWIKKGKAELNHSLISVATRGFFKTKEEALDVVKLYPDIILEGFYERLIISPVVFGLDNFSENHRQESVYLEYDDETESYIESSRMEHFKGTLF